MKRTILFFLTAAWLAIASSAFGGERFENVVLYVVSETDAGATLTFDSWRSASFAADAAISDATDRGIVDVATLARAIGTAPDLEKAAVGDVVGTELNDVVLATVELTDDGAIASVAATGRATRPLVGISWTGRKVGSAQRTIASAILRNGGRARFLPQVANDEDCEAALRDLDGFFMPGGADLDPALYGEEAYPHGSVGIQHDRDVSDCLTTRRALATNLPGLWVCRGEQTMNVALGGALIQDVPSFQGRRVAAGELAVERTELIPDAGAPTAYDGGPKIDCMPKHYRVFADGIRHGSGNRHAIAISEDSKFLKPIVGASSFPSVMTSHHQAADPERLGEGLTVVATAPDGIVEALEYQKNDFDLATQFHFEYDTRSGDPAIASYSAKFFLTLLRFAREYRAKADSAP